MDTSPMLNFVICWIIRILFMTGSVLGHGRLWEPPSRSTMWRLGYNTSININDNELNCGGFKNQWITYGGLCGVCGDPYQQQPRENEAGGKYASGLITRLYTIGQDIDVTVDVTANHGGYFEFRLCPIKGHKYRETNDCFDRYLLLVNDLPGDDFKYHIKDRSLQGHMNMTVRLPPNISCRHCVLQWRYWTASRWGCEADVCGKGMGPQEEFYGCSDIAIAPPYAYDSYRRLIAIPSPNRVGYSIQDNGEKKEELISNSKGRVQIVLSEFVDGSKNTLHDQTPPPIFPRPDDLPKTKTFFKVPTIPNQKLHLDTKKHLSEELQKILVETISNYYKRDGKTYADKEQRCIAKGRFSRNPIIQEWCTRGCPGLSRACPPKMCYCRSWKVRKETLPFIELSKYKTELINKVPFELSNMLSTSQLPDKTDKSAFKHDKYLYSNSPRGSRRLSRKNSWPKILRTKPPSRRKQSLIDFWKDAPFTAELGQYTRFPLITRSKPKLYLITSRRDSKRKKERKTDFKSVPAPSRGATRVKTHFPLKTSHRYFTRPPVVAGLTFFSAIPRDEKLKSERKLKSQAFSQGIFLPKQNSQSSLKQTFHEHRLAPLRPKTIRDLSIGPIKVAPRNIVCSASTIFGHVNSMIEWCQKNCSFGFCPPSVCKCL